MLYILKAQKIRKQYDDKSKNSLAKCQKYLKKGKNTQQINRKKLKMRNKIRRNF